MGWTSCHATHCYRNGKINRKAECDAYFLEGLNRGFYKVLRSAMHGSVYYAAVQPIRKCSVKDGTVVYQDIPENLENVYGVVAQTQIDNHSDFNFSYKIITEDMGPCYYDCPENILKLLPPTDDEFALNWREKCHAANQRRRILKNCGQGTQIRFQSEVALTSGIQPGETITLTRICRIRQGRRQNIWFDGMYSWKEEWIPEKFEII